jgi:hypothetical protein
LLATRRSPFMIASLLWACLAGLLLGSGSSRGVLPNVLPKKPFFSEKLRSWSRGLGGAKKGVPNKTQAPQWAAPPTRLWLLQRIPSRGALPNTPRSNHFEFILFPLMLHSLLYAPLLDSTDRLSSLDFNDMLVSISKSPLGWLGHYSS